MGKHLTYGEIPMSRQLFAPGFGFAASILVPLIALSPVAADDPPKTPRPTTEVEISFANGSLVRMVLADAPVEVLTDYGKLSIPARDLKRVEFGVHLPEGLEKQLAQTVAELGSENFRVRETATTSLLKHGGLAIPSLLEAGKSTDIELSKRAKALLAKLQQALPKKEFRTSDGDTIVTPKFTIVGKILTPTLKAETEYFGAVTLDLVKLRKLRSTETPAELVLQLDAAKYGGQALQWLKTEFELDGRNKLVVAASGQVDLWPEGGGGGFVGQYMSSPRGFGNAPGFGRVGRQNFLPGALIGKVGESGAPFLIGEAYDGSPSGEGALFLQIVPSPWNNEASGAYQVKISAK
jgi:hypothetical protein